ncbi:MAG: plasmid stabilization protein [Phenylobacterium sp.]|nr:plasmid stabilization protein [Phenylobacterium sp.]
MGDPERGPAYPRRAVLALAGAAIAAPVSAAPRVVTVTMRDMAFGAVPTGLRVGDIVEWVNLDLFRHTATARNKAFDVDLVPRARARTVLRQPGVVAFYCRFHPGMTGVLEVAK